MDTPINSSFTSLAYALILFRETGYPCVFYGDMFGISEPFVSPPTCDGKLADLVLARNLYAYGEQQDYFQEANCVGWVRGGQSAGHGSQAAGMAVVMSWVRKDAGPHHAHALPTRPSWMRRLSSLSETFGKRRGGSNQYQKRMNVGVQHAGEVWTDILGGSLEKVSIGHGGYGVFPCQKNSVAVYVFESAEGRERFPVNFEGNIDQYTW
jgi:alpha-amylase